MTAAPGRFRWLAGATDEDSLAERRKWSVVGASGLLTGLGHGFVQFAISALLKPLANDLDMSRAGVSVAVSLGRLVQGLNSLFAGVSVDRWGARRVVALGTVVMAAGLAAMAFVRGPLNLYLGWGHRFRGHLLRVHRGDGPDRGRELARGTGIRPLGPVHRRRPCHDGAGALIVWLIESFGWRTTCLVWGAVMLLTLPLPLRLFEDEGSASRARAHSSPVPDLAPSANLRQALGTRTFWILALAYMSIAGTISGVSVHSIPMLTDRGVPTTLAGIVFGVLVLLSIPSRLLTGIFADRLPARILPRILGAVLIVESLTFFAEAALETLPTLYLMLVAKGIATGVPTVLIVVLIVARYGQDSLGSIQGSLMLLQVPGTMAGPVLAGWAHDTTGSYSPAIAIFACLLLVSGLALQFATARERS